MTAVDMVRELHARGITVVLRHGKVVLRGPRSAITEEIRIVAGTMRDELQALVEGVEEQIARYENDGGVETWEATERAWGEALGDEFRDTRAREGAVLDG